MGAYSPCDAFRPWFFATLPSFCGRKCTVTGRRGAATLGQWWSICRIYIYISSKGPPRFWPAASLAYNSSGGLCGFWSLGASGESGRARLRGLGKGKMALARRRDTSRAFSFLFSPNLCMPTPSFKQLQMAEEFSGHSARLRSFPYPLRWCWAARIIISARSCLGRGHGCVPWL